MDEHNSKMNPEEKINPQDGFSAREADTKSGRVSVSFKLETDGVLDLDNSNLEGHVEYTGGGRTKHYIPSSPTTSLGSARSKSNDLTFGRLAERDRDASILRKTSSRSPEISIPDSMSQMKDTELGAFPVIPKTYDRMFQNLIVNGKSGTDPNKGVPFRVFARNVLFHPNGMNIVVPRSEREITHAWRSVPAIPSTTPATAVTGANKQGVTNMEDEGDWLTTAIKLTLKATEYKLEAVNDENLVITPTRSQYKLMNDVRTQMHNQALALADVINSKTTSSRVDATEERPYSPLNTSEFTAKWRVRVIDSLMHMLNETGVAVFLAYLSAILNHSFSRRMLSHDGQRDATITAEWTMRNLLGAAETANFNEEDFNSINKRFATSWAAIGSAFHTLLLHETDKKFTDDNSKTGFYGNPRGFLYQFTTEDGLKDLSSIIMDSTMLETILAEYFFTKESSENEGSLYVTDETSLTFTHKVSGHLRPHNAFVVDNGQGEQITAFFADETATGNLEPSRYFISLPYIDGAGKRKIYIVNHFLWSGVRDWLDENHSHYFEQLRKAETESKSLESVEILIPLNFSTTQTSLFGALIANSVEYIAKRVKELNSMLRTTLQPFGGKWPFEVGQSEVEVTDEFGNARTINGWKTFYEAMDTKPHHFSRAESMKSVLFAGIEPGVFDSEGRDFLVWHMPDQWTALSRVKYSDTDNGNEVAYYDLIELPRGTATLDYRRSPITVSESNPLTAGAVNLYSKYFPELAYEYYKLDSEIARISVPYRSTLTLNPQSADLFNFDARRLFFRNRTIEAHIEDDGGYDGKFIGAPVEVNYNAAGVGRACIYGKNLASQFTMSWFLKRPRNHGTATPLPRSLWTQPINQTSKNTNPWAETKLSADGKARTANMLIQPFSQSILGCSGIKMIAWRKFFSPETVQAYNYAMMSDVKLLIGCWEVFECCPGYTGVFGMKAKTKLSPFTTAFNASIAWESRDNSMTQAFAAEYDSAGNPILPSEARYFDKSNTGRIIVEKAFNKAAQNGNGQQSRTYLPQWEDMSINQYLNTWVLDDPFGMWNRALIQTDYNAAASRGSDFAYNVAFDPDEELYSQGLGGWIPYDFSLYANQLADLRVSLGRNYTRRINTEDVVKYLNKSAHQVNVAADEVKEGTA